MRSDKLMIRLNAEEKKLLETAAKGHDMAIASWARRELLKNAMTYQKESQIYKDQPEKKKVGCFVGFLQPV